MITHSTDSAADFLGSQPSSATYYHWICRLDKSFNLGDLVLSCVPILWDCFKINQVKKWQVVCHFWFFWLLLNTLFPSKPEHSFRILLNTALHPPWTTDQRWLKRWKLFVSLGIIVSTGLAALLHVFELHDSTKTYTFIIFNYRPHSSTYYLHLWNELWAC